MARHRAVVPVRRGLGLIEKMMPLPNWPTAYNRSRKGSQEGCQLLGAIPQTVSEIAIPLVDEITEWEIRAADDEEEEEHYP